MMNPADFQNFLIDNPSLSELLSILIVILIGFALSFVIGNKHLKLSIVLMSIALIAIIACIAGFINTTYIAFSILFIAIGMYLEFKPTSGGESVESN
jgi:uncharacterized membrane protein